MSQPTAQQFPKLSRIQQARLWRCARLNGAATGRMIRTSNIPDAITRDGYGNGATTRSLIFTLCMMDNATTLSALGQAWIEHQIARAEAAAYDLDPAARERAERLGQLRHIGTFRGTCLRNSCPGCEQSDAPEMRAANVIVVNPATVDLEALATAAGFELATETEIVRVDVEVLDTTGSPYRVGDRVVVTAKDYRQGLPYTGTVSQIRGQGEAGWSYFVDTDLPSQPRFVFVDELALECTPTSVELGITILCSSPCRIHFAEKMIDAPTAGHHQQATAAAWAAGHTATIAGVVADVHAARRVYAAATFRPANYEVYEAGAATIADARRMAIGNAYVTANTYLHPDTNAPRLAVFVGVRMAYDGPMPDVAQGSPEFYTLVRDLAVEATSTPPATADEFDTALVERCARLDHQHVPAGHPRPDLETVAAAIICYARGFAGMAVLVLDDGEWLPARVDSMMWRGDGMVVRTLDAPEAPIRAEFARLRFIGRTHVQRAEFAAYAARPVFAEGFYAVTGDGQPFRMRIRTADIDGFGISIRTYTLPVPPQGGTEIARYERLDHARAALARFRAVCLGNGARIVEQAEAMSIADALRADSEPRCDEPTAPATLAGGADLAAGDAVYAQALIMNARWRPNAGQLAAALLSA